jgi:hypothetical protein
VASHKVVGQRKEIQGVEERASEMTNKYGHPQSEETKKKISEALSGERGHWWGISPSEETREKQRRAMVGRKFTKEHKNKISVALKGKAKSLEARQHMSENHADRNGEKNPNWNGGQTLRAGYIMVQKRGHPFADMHGYVLKHRLIAEKAIGRFLKPTEIVHHVNRDVKDNRNCNLVICQDHSYHRLLHTRMKQHGAR